jgi:hypothetical protein
LVKFGGAMDVECLSNGTKSVMSPGYAEQLAQYESGITETQNLIKVRCQMKMFGPCFGHELRSRYCVARYKRGHYDPAINDACQAINIVFVFNSFHPLWGTIAIYFTPGRSEESKMEKCRRNATIG